MNLLGKSEIDEDVEMLYEKTYHVSFNRDILDGEILTGI